MLVDICSNPLCYNKPATKRWTKIGTLKIEAPLCNKCAQAADAIDIQRLHDNKQAIFAAMTKYHNLHQMQGRVPPEMLTMALERILDEAMGELK